MGTLRLRLVAACCLCSPTTCALYSRCAHSLLFYFSVFCAELAPHFTVFFKMCATKKSMADLDDDAGLENNPKLEADLANISMSSNAMNDPTQSRAMYANKEARLEAEAKQARQELEGAQATMDSMKQEIARMKKEAQLRPSGGDHSLLSSVSSKVRGLRSKRKEFAPQRTGSRQSPAGSEESIRISRGSKFDMPNPMAESGLHRHMSSPKAAKKSPTVAAPAVGSAAAAHDNL